MRIIFLTIALFCLFCPPGFSAVSVRDAWGEGGVSVTITDGSTGERLFLLMIVAEDENTGRILDSIEIGGVKMTQYSYDSVGSAFVVHVGMFYLLDAGIPGTGSSVTTYWSGDLQSEGIATVTLEGVDQDTPITDTDSIIDASNFTSGDIILDHAAGDYTATSTIGSSSGKTISWINATEIFEYTLSTASGALSADTEPSGGSSTITTSFSSNVSRAIVRGINVFAVADGEPAADISYVRRIKEGEGK